MDKITIITASYNCVDEIEKSIISVLEQDYTDIEYIVIDGASTDGTVEVIKKYADRISYWVSEPDDGLYYAMNKGIEAATGDWIYIHNAGGVFYEKNTLSKLFSNNLVGVDAFFGYIWSVKSNCFFQNPIPFYEQKGNNKRPGYSHQALFIRTEWCKKNLFDTSYRCCADFNQAMQIWKAGAKFQYIDVPVVKAAPAGFSAKNRRIQYVENARINGIENTAGFRWTLLLKDIKTYIRKILY
ncbi:MAG: glycosyltransferase family 2 protein [Bacteroidales bacterium]|nr:glycosyltransferase family 2 protein [Bacteroidales bacterium]